MKARMLAGLVAVLVVASGCAAGSEGLLPNPGIVLMGSPPFCERQGAVTYRQTVDAGRELELGTNNRVLVTAPAGAVRPGEQVTVTLNVHSSSSLAFDVFVEGHDAYAFDTDLTIRVNTATCRVPTNPYLIKIGQNDQATVRLEPQNGNSRVYTGTVRSLSLFILAAPG